MSDANEWADYFERALRAKNGPAVTPEWIIAVLRTEDIKAPATDCKASIDGWCETHSTGDGPAWCADSLKLALRRARFHERENYQRIKDERARAERYRLAWLSARRYRSAWFAARERDKP